MKFAELKERAEQLIEDDLIEAATEILAERIREIKNLENLLTTAKEQHQKLLDTAVEDVVEI